MLPVIQLSPRSRYAVSAEQGHARDRARQPRSPDSNDMDDRRDFADADAGLIAPWPDQVVGADRHVISDPAWSDRTRDAATSRAVSTRRSSAGATRPR